MHLLAGLMSGLVTQKFPVAEGFLRRTCKSSDSLAAEAFQR